MKTLTFVLILFFFPIQINALDSFDVSQKWPQCKDVFEDIQTQGNCSSSWAISVATSIRDRRCITSGIKEPLSAYDLISCCHDCQLDGKNGCNGGNHDSAFHYFIDQGIVTESCKAYPISPDPKSDAPKSTECIKKCDFSYKKSYENDKIKGKGQISFAYNNQAVMDEIMKNGPAVAEFELYDDFLSYKGGIYQYKLGKKLGYYYAKILGWDINDVRMPFWKAAASFGNNWGENGTFRIAMRFDNVGFESNIVAGLITPANLDCQKITAYYNGTFKDLIYSSEIFDAQFEINSDINLEDKRVYFKFNNWNKTYTKGYQFCVWDGDHSICCNTTQKEPCSVPFEDLSRFNVEFFPYNRLYWPDLIHIIPLINKKFTLVNAVGNCATSLQNNNLTLDSSLYKSCFCCGDKYNPDPSLKCPVSPWS